MQYCANCGAAVEGRFCAKCGSPAVAGAAPPPPDPAAAGPTPGYVPPHQAYGPPPSLQGLGMEENLAAALCYIPIIGLVFLLLEPYSKNRTIRFHAWQSILYCAAWFVIMIGLTIMLAVFHAVLPFGTWGLFSLVMRLVQLALLLGLIFAAVKAYQRERLFLPIIGPIAEKQA